MPLPRPAPGTLRWWVIGTIGVGLGVAWAIWWGLSATVGLPSFQTVGYKVVDDQSVRVTFSVHSPDGAAVTCRVQALARDFSTVGTLDVPIPASADADSQRTVTVRTTTRAVTGEVRTCN